MSFVVLFNCCEICGKSYAITYLLHCNKLFLTVNTLEIPIQSLYIKIIIQVVAELFYERNLMIVL